MHLSLGASERGRLGRQLGARRRRHVARHPARDEALAAVLRGGRVATVLEPAEARRLG